MRTTEATLGYGILAFLQEFVYADEPLPCRTPHVRVKLAPRSDVEKPRRRLRSTSLVERAGRRLSPIRHDVAELRRQRGQRWE